MRKHLISFTLALLLLISLCFAQTTKEQKDPGHVMFTPSQIKWQAAPTPGQLPSGAQIAVLDGDPSQAGAFYTVGIKMPSGYRIPPHWHPMDASVTVVQGVFAMGLGEKFDSTR